MNLSSSEAEPTDPESDLFKLLIRYDEELAGESISRQVTVSTDNTPLSPQIERLRTCLNLLENDRRQKAQFVTPDGDIRNQQFFAGSGSQSLSDNPDADEFQIARFQVIRRLGSGGFGVVFLARDPVLKRLVAVKVPRPEAITIPAFHDRFIRESQFVASLNHPYIVPIFEAGQDGPISFQVMAYCAGGTLSEWLRSPSRQKHDAPGASSSAIKRRHARVNTSVAVELVIKLSEAVHFAHQQGILHRDLKPSNILLNTYEESFTSETPATASIGQQDLNRTFRPMVADFGLARLYSEHDASTDPVTHRRTNEPLLNPSEILQGHADDSHSSRADTASMTDLAGTFQYMAPEQLQRKRELIGPATDVWGLGTILYEMLTGIPPFSSEMLNRTDPTTRPANVTAPGKISSEIPRDLEAICLKCLAPVPSERYSDVQKLVDDLRSYCRGEPVTARPWPLREQFIRWLKRRPAVASLLLFCLLLISSLMLLGIWHLNRLTEVNRELHRTASERELLAETAQRESLRSSDLAWLAEQREYAASMIQAAGALKRNEPGQMNESLQRFVPQNGFEDYSGFEWRYLWDQGQCLRPWLGHTDDVLAGTLTQDGRSFYTIGKDDTIRLWDRRTGTQKQIQKLGGQGNNEVARFSRDAVRAVINRDLEDSGIDESVVRDLKTGTILIRREHGVHNISTCDIAVDGRYAVIAGHRELDGTFTPFAEMLFPDSETFLADEVSFGRIAVDGHIHGTHSVSAVALLPDKHEMILAFIIADGPWRYQLARCALNTELPDALNSGRSPFRDLTAIGSLQHGLPMAITMSSNGDCCAIRVGGGPNCVDVWDLKAASLILRTEQYTEPPYAAAFSPDETHLAIAASVLNGSRGNGSFTAGSQPENSSRHRITLHDLRSKQTNDLNFPAKRNIWYIKALETQSATSWLIGEAGGALNLWRPDSPQPFTALSGHSPYEAWCVDVSPNGSVLFTGGDDHVVRSWDLDSGKVQHVSTERTQLVSCVAVSPDAQWVAAGGYDDMVVIHEARTLTTVAELSGHTHDVRAIAFSTDGTLLASAGRDRIVRLWSVPDFKAVGTLEGHEDTIRTLHWMADGGLVSGDSDGKLLIHNSKGRIVCSRMESEGIHAVDFAPAGIRLPVAHIDIKHQSEENLPNSTAPEASGADRLTVTFDADQLLAFGTNHGTVKVWHVPTDTVWMEAHYPGVEIRSLCFSPDGRILAVAGNDGAIHLRHLATNREVLTLDHPGSPVNSIAFSPDGRILSAAMHDGSVRLWLAPDPMADRGSSTGTRLP